jgi:hypothetical protein
MPVMDLQELLGPTSAAEREAAEAAEDLFIFVIGKKLALRFLI